VENDRLDLLQGTLEVLILRSLKLQPNHAYGISQFLQLQSVGFSKPPQPEMTNQSPAAFFESWDLPADSLTRPFDIHKWRSRWMSALADSTI
jgi:hypothetical protein